MKKILFFIVLSALSLPALADPNLRVEISDWYNEMTHVTSPQVIITSAENSVTINNVTLNRGNCAIWTYKNLYLKTLKFGQQVTVKPLGQCEIVEISIDTDKGNATYSAL